MRAGDRVEAVAESPGHALIDAAFDRSRTVLLTLLLILVSGTVAYLTIPKESEPDVAIPIIYVSMTHEGISPEDAERLLVRPMEKELQGIEGVKEMRSTAGEGHASVLLEFDAGFDSDQALVITSYSIHYTKLYEAYRHRVERHQRQVVAPAARLGLGEGAARRQHLPERHDPQHAQEASQADEQLVLGDP